MRVYDTNLTGALAEETSRAQEAQKVDRLAPAQSSNLENVSGTDRVELSGALGRLSEALSSFQQGRASRVEALATQ